MVSQSTALNIDQIRGRTILVTGHTGFKGAWLTLWLHKLGAEVHGLSLPENPAPAAYTALGVRKLIASERLADVRDAEVVSEYLAEVKPDLVFHLAAQALVRKSYKDPLGTLATNFMGTTHVLEALRTRNKKCACIVVTSDKCYQNLENKHAYRETDALGGLDIYSASKSAAELVTAGYRKSFFATGNVALASARAGNVMGGGDYAPDRIVPDCVRALSKGQKIPVRNPASTRPWQHVLEPLSGYLLLACKLLGPESQAFADAWNFGPSPREVLNVKAFVENFIAQWGTGAWEPTREAQPPHEAQLLNLNSDKAAARLGWAATWTSQRRIRETVEWYRKFEASPKQEGGMREFSLEQIGNFDAKS
ncbi:MAG: CDP-glucose 4,6-dehydratase [Deltaproteobacteria bacterium]|nr:CDP-glucose 4,6-dehydratase [Deltaproteobacteria bacterium]